MKSHAFATISSGGSPVNSGVAFAVPLQVGSNFVSLVVTAQDGSTTRSYTLTALRLAPPQLVVEQALESPLASIGLVGWGDNTQGQLTPPRGGDRPDRDRRRHLP